MIFPFAFWGTQNLRALIPIMSGYTTPSGVASASSDGASISQYYAWMAFDNNNSTFWDSYSGYFLNSWLKYQFPIAKIVKKYSIMLAFVASTSFSLQGSNDGSTFTTLGTNSDSSGLLVTFSVNNNTPYLYYRILITSYSSGGSGGIKTLQLYGY